MDQNPNYFSGYFTADRKVDVQQMDTMLLERCRPWVYASDPLTTEAALSEYVDAVIDLIGLDGMNPRHRYDVQEQALSTINVLVNAQGRQASLFANQETRMYMREQFLMQLTAQLLDRKFGNAYNAPTAALTQRRNELRGLFQTVLNVDPSIIANAEVTPRIAANDVREKMTTPGHLQVECTDRHRGLALARALGKEARKRGWKIHAGFTQSGMSGTLEIYPKNLSGIQRRNEHPDAVVQAILQPVEEYLKANGCTPGSIIQDDPQWLTFQWRQQ